VSSALASCEPVPCFAALFVQQSSAGKFRLIYKSKNLGAGNAGHLNHVFLYFARSRLPGRWWRGSQGLPICRPRGKIYAQKISTPTLHHNPPPSSRLLHLKRPTCSNGKFSPFVGGARPSLTHPRTRRTEMSRMPASTRHGRGQLAPRIDNNIFPGKYRSTVSGDILPCLPGIVTEAEPVYS